MSKLNKKLDREKIAEKVAEILLSINAIALNPKKPYAYASGILSPVYTDCRILISNPKIRKVIINYILEMIRFTNKTFDIIAGTATAGIPHAAWIADKLNLPMIYVRGKAKDHGKGNQIEGLIKKNQKAAVIEDLISTGESSAGTILAIRNTGGKASHVFSIITYEMKKSQENFKLNKITLNSLTTFSKVVEVAQKNNYIKENEQKTILEWIKDPPAWGKKMGFE